MLYDCFTFFNELDLLEIRLNVLNDVVDKFVLVEATKTHQGKDKPLYFSEHKIRYSKFLDKIIHVVVDDYPDFEGKSAWILERHQRNMISKGIRDCKADDVILISDVDEIPDPGKITAYRNQPGIKIFLQRMYYYFLNCVNASLKNNFRWPGTVMIDYRDLISPQHCRDLSIAITGFYSPRLLVRWYVKLKFYLSTRPKGKKLILVDGGGWHFSYLGGVEAIIKKLEAFAHSEYNKEELKDEKKLGEAIASGKDIFGRDFTYQFVALDATFPEYIRNNKNNFAHLIKN